MRFHYKDNVAGGFPPADVSDADVDVAENHLHHLGSVLEDWEHVIVVVEAGFVGVWGEWYYSENHNDPGTGWTPTPANLEERKKIVEALLVAFPSRQILHSWGTLLH